MYNEKLKKIYQDVIEENNLLFDDDINNIDYLSLFCKATSKNKLYRLLECNLCMFKCSYEEKDSVLIIFSIPHGSESSLKQVSDKIMEIITILEKTFILLDYVITDEVKDDKFIYVTVIKNI